MLIVCQGWRVEEGRLDKIEDYDLDFQSKYESLTFPTEGGGGKGNKRKEMKKEKNEKNVAYLLLI